MAKTGTETRGIGDIRCAQNMRQLVYTLRKGPYLNREYNRGVGSMKELIHRKKEIKRLIREEEERMGRFELIKEKMKRRYLLSGKQKKNKHTSPKTRV